MAQKNKLDRYWGPTAVNRHSLPVPSGTKINEPILIAMAGGDVPAVAMTNEGEDGNPAGFATCITPSAQLARRLLVDAPVADVLVGALIYHDGATAYDEDAGTTPLNNNALGTLWGRVMQPSVTLTEILVPNGTAGIVPVLIGQMPI